MTYGIQAQPFTKAIVVARLSRDRKRMLGDKQDVTDETILAVAQFAQHHFDGQLEADFTDAAGFKVQVRVVEVGAGEEQ